MKAKAWVLVALPVLMFVSGAAAQGWIMDMVANRVIQKYQNATCEQLWQERAQGPGQPKSEEEQRAIALLQQNPGMQAAFFGQVATPIATKLFQCGMIP